MEPYWPQFRLHRSHREKQEYSALGPQALTPGYIYFFHRIS